MIYGIGTDAVEVARIDAALQRHGARFAQRILGPQELAAYERRAARSARRGLMFLATRFAAKEAVSKAIGLGMRDPMHWRAAQVVSAPSGRPEIRADAGLEAFLCARRLRLHVTLTDLEHIAVAVAVAEAVPAAEPYP